MMQEQQIVVRLDKALFYLKKREESVLQVLLAIDKKYKKINYTQVHLLRKQLERLQKIDQAQSENQHRLVHELKEIKIPRCSPPIQRVIVRMYQILEIANDRAKDIVNLPSFKSSGLLLLRQKIQRCQVNCQFSMLVQQALKYSKEKAQAVIEKILSINQDDLWQNDALQISLKQIQIPNQEEISKTDSKQKSFLPSFTPYTTHRIKEESNWSRTQRIIKENREKSVQNRHKLNRLVKIYRQYQDLGLDKQLFLDNRSSNCKKDREGLLKDLYQRNDHTAKIIKRYSDRKDYQTVVTRSLSRYRITAWKPDIFQVPDAPKLSKRKIANRKSFSNNQSKIPIIQKSYQEPQRAQFNFKDVVQEDSFIRVQNHNSFISRYYATKGNAFRNNKILNRCKESECQQNGRAQYLIRGVGFQKLSLQ